MDPVGRQSLPFFGIIAARIKRNRCTEHGLIGIIILNIQFGDLPGCGLPDTPPQDDTIRNYRGSFDCCHKPRFEEFQFFPGFSPGGELYRTGDRNSDPGMRSHGYIPSQPRYTRPANLP